jgi:hypothetical protein
MDMEGKAIKMKISILALTLVIILGVGISSAQEGPPLIYLGQTTWSLKITQDTVDSFMVGQKVTLKGGITRVGDGYYLFQGTMLWGSTRKVLAGGGLLVGAKLMLSVNVSSKSAEGDCSNGVMHFILSQSNLNGSVTEVESGVIPPNGFGHNYIAGTLTRTGQMVPLN